MEYNIEKYRLDRLVIKNLFCVTVEIEYSLPGRLRRGAEKPAGLTP